MWLEHVGETVSVYSPMLFTNDRMSLAIQYVTSTRGTSPRRGPGTLASLGLVLPERFNGGGQIEGGSSCVPVIGSGALGAPSETDGWRVGGAWRSPSFPTISGRLSHPAASGAGASEGRAAADPGPGGADRHPVRAAHRFAVGVPAAGDGMRLGDVVLATAA